MLNCSSSLHAGDSELCWDHQNNSMFVPDRLFLQDPGTGQSLSPTVSCELGKAAAAFVLGSPGSCHLGHGPACVP